jgi:hypothetical protein
MLYIGSCRYMYEYEWEFFPPRLHTTKEIIHFLEHIDHIQEVIDANPRELAFHIFGGFTHPTVREELIRFFNTPFNKDTKKIILEICSRKLYYYNNVPCSWYYVHDTDPDHLIPTYHLQYTYLSDDDIDQDLKRIVELCKEKFHETVEIHVIPHLDLKTKTSGTYIPERHRFVKVLETLCEKYGIPIHNVGAYIESFDSESFLEDYMSDSTHYSKNYDKVKAFLIRTIIG